MYLAGSGWILRPSIGLLVTALLTGTTLPAAAAAQDDPASLPGLTPGTYEGRFIFEGYTAHDTESSDGSFGVGTTDVLATTDIPVELVVHDDGTVSGSMLVDLRYVDEGAGADSAGFPYHVVHDSHQTGQLLLSGDLERIVASGALQDDSRTLVESDIVEEVSGTASVDVEWVFPAPVVVCDVATAPLMEASGSSLVRSALLPAEYSSGPTTRYNNLTAVLSVRPAQEVTSEEVSALEEEVVARADELEEVPWPKLHHFTDLFAAWYELQDQVDAHNACGPPAGFVSTSFDRPWLVVQVGSELTEAIEGWALYDVEEFGGFWAMALAEGILDSELRNEFYDSLATKLEIAVEASDTETIEAIFAFAEARYWDDMQAQAGSALD